MSLRFRSTSLRLRLIVVALTVLGSSAAAAQQPEPPEYVRQILSDAQQAGGDIPGQAAALASLAWSGLDSPSSDPLVRAAARQRLIGYGHHALPVIRRMIPDLDPLLQADATAALIEARYRNMSGMPQDFLPGLEEAIWFGSVEAQRVALNELIRYNFPPMVMSSVDAVYASPELAVYVIRSLGRAGDRRALFFLQDALFEGADYAKPAAARALVDLGGDPVNVLRRGAESDDPTTRQVSMAAFLPLAGIDDLTLLHEYYAQRTGDDPKLRAAVRERATALETEFEEIQEAESATPIEEP